MPKYLAFTDGLTPDGKLPENERESLFRFGADFFDKFQSVSPTELAGAVPYISLHSLDRNGDIIQDLNVDFFFKTIDYASMDQSQRYGDRPTMSLRSVDLKTSQPPGSGYLYFTEVVLTLKLHAPEDLNYSQVMSLTLPGMNHRLEYGWNSVGSNGNDFLNEKQVLLFQIATYDVNFDESGQVDLVVRGIAFHDYFKNTRIGDTGQENASELASDANIAGIAKGKDIQTKNEEAVKDAKNAEGGINEAPIASVAQHVATNEQISRGEFSKEFKRRLTTLEELKSDGIYTLHDVVSTMLGPTIDALVTDIWPSPLETRVIYGDINAKAEGSGIPTSLANFPINAEIFNAKIQDWKRRGIHTPTVREFFNMLTNDFLENTQLWAESRDDNPDNPTQFNKPDIVVFFNNRSVVKNDTVGTVIELIIHDVRFGLPVTTADINRSENVRKTTKAERENIIIENNLPIMRLGHANSFVKKATLSHVRDQAMNSALIARMFQDRQDGPRSSKVASKSNKSVPTTPLTLPVQGTLDVLGHVQWTPFKAFYLDAGTYLLSSVYKIMAVRHRLSADGFTTMLDIFPN